VNHSEIVSFLWGVADLIRDTFKRGKYQDVILPLTVLRRLDCVLADTKERVLKRQAELKGKGLGDPDAQLPECAVSPVSCGPTSRRCNDAAARHQPRPLGSG
jgi:type I restriction enzyme M protein